MSFLSLYFRHNRGPEQNAVDWPIAGADCRTGSGTRFALVVPPSLSCHVGIYNLPNTCYQEDAVGGIRQTGSRCTGRRI